MAGISHRWQFSVVPVWLLAAVGVTLALGSTDRIRLLALVLIAGVLATFLAQLATRTPNGFVERARLSISGVLILVIVGGLVSLLIGAGVAG